MTTGKTTIEKRRGRLLGDNIYELNPQGESGVSKSSYSNIKLFEGQR